MSKIVLFLLITLSSCNKEGAYEYVGVVASANHKTPLDSVSCSLYIDNILYKEQLTDSTGQFNISWSGYINKHEGLIKFNKNGFEEVIIYGNQQSSLIDDTIFLVQKINR